MLQLYDIMSERFPHPPTYLVKLKSINIDFNTPFSEIQAYRLFQFELSTKGNIAFSFISQEITEMYCNNMDLIKFNACFP
ncbi:hypothetical protein ACF0H5_020199 [Mactra antiquata]